MDLQLAKHILMLGHCLRRLPNCSDCVATTFMVRFFTNVNVNVSGSSAWGPNEEQTIEANFAK